MHTESRCAGIVLFGGLGVEKPLEVSSEIFKGRAGVVGRVDPAG